MQKISSYGVLMGTLVITWLLNISIGGLPPIAKFLDPFQGFWQNAERTDSTLPTQLSVPGLIAPVEIYFDEALIPHIEAKNDKDLYFAQGYITAFHRLWQMEFQTHIAAGRVAEIVGLRGVAHDRLQRRKGMVYAAKNALDIIEKDILMSDIVQCYTNGVNAYINSLNYKKLPVEYKLLSYTPEQWTPFKTAIVGIQLADILTAFDQSLEYIQGFDLLNKDAFSLLFPTADLVNDPVIPKGTLWPFKPALIPSPPVPMPGAVELAKKPSKPHEIVHRPINGSNNWAVTGKKTTTGLPYLGADLHVNLRLPSSWYSIHLITPEVNVIGISLPGAPGVLMGFNESVAWGITNASWCAREWYSIDFKDATRAEYYCDNVLLKSQFVVEAIKVKNADVLYDTVVYTHLGPIVYDDHFNNPRYYRNLAMKWAGHHPGSEIFGFYLLNRAKNLTECEKALTHHYVPIQNFAFASVENDIAMEVIGRLPIRFKDQGRFVMPGNISGYNSLSAIPLDQHPKIVNPQQGYVSSANQRTIDKNYPYYYFQLFEESYRNRRINQVLGQLQKVDSKAMMHLQNDNYNLAAQENMAFLLGFIDHTQLDSTQAQAYQTLLSWDFENNTEQIAPSIFKAWQIQLDSKLWHSLQNYPLALPQPSFYQTMYILKNHANSPYLMLGSYASLADLVVDSFKKAVEELQTWQSKHQRLYKWGDYNNISIPHLASFNTFGMTNVQVGGGEGIVNANYNNHGASVRLLVSLEKMPKGWLTYPGGQPGNPGSPYYTQFVDDWCKGKYVPLSLTLPIAAKRNKGSQLILMPA